MRVLLTIAALAYSGAAVLIAADLWRQFPRRPSFTAWVTFLTLAMFWPIPFIITTFTTHKEHDQHG